MVRDTAVRGQGVRIIIFAAIVIAAIVLIVTLRKKNAKEPPAVAEGVTYLMSLENADTAEVDAILQQQREARIAAEREKVLAQLQNGEVDVWSLFTDYAVMGDSRAVGFSFYGFLPEERVLAGAGWTIKNILEEMDNLVALNPSSVFLCFGLNDSSIGYWDNPDEYAAEYLEILGQIKERLPGATIYVSSILPAKDPAFDRAEVWRHLPEWSARVAEELEGTEYVYVDNTDICAEYTDLWDIDGIHVMKSFYPYWGANLMMAVYDRNAASSGEEAYSELAADEGAEDAAETEDTGEAAAGEETEEG